MGNYLGNNIEVDGGSASKFQPLVEKVQKRVWEWKNMTLSHAGEVLLINAILASLCQHVLSKYLQDSCGGIIREATNLLETDGDN